MPDTGPTPRRAGNILAKHEGSTMRSHPFTARHVPPPMPPAVLVTITLVFALLSFTRGLDYSRAAAPAGGSLVVLNALGDVRLWGAVLCAGAAGVGLAYLTRRHFLVWCSHVVMLAVYGCMAVTIAQSLLLTGGGWAPFVAPAGAVVWHGLMVLMVKPFPPGVRRGA